jgi:hypothetical protein
MEGELRPTGSRPGLISIQWNVRQLTDTITVMMTLCLRRMKVSMQ